MSRIKDVGALVLFKGQRKARRHHECIHCQRNIERNEYYHVKVVLMFSDGIKWVDTIKSCCKVV